MESKEALRNVYGFYLPDDFWKFSEFVDQLPESILGGIDSLLGIKLSSIFSDLKTSKIAQNYLESERSVLDLPEFFTMMSGITDGEHWGYWTDDPTKGKFCVAYFYTNDAINIKVVGSDLFDAFRLRLEQIYCETEDVEQLNILNSIREKMHLYKEDFSKEIGWDYLDKYENAFFAERRKIINIETEDLIGIVAPKGSFKEIRDLKPYNIWNKKKIETAKIYTKKYPGLSLLVGRELFLYYPEYFNDAVNFLMIGYKKLGRESLIIAFDAAVKSRSVSI